METRHGYKTYLHFPWTFLLFTPNVYIIRGVKLFVGNFFCLFSGGLNELWRNLKKWKVEVKQIASELEAFLSRRKLYWLFVGNEKFIGWLIDFELCKTLHINLSGLLNPTLHPLMFVLHTNFVPYLELNVPQTNTGLCPLVKSARHWVWSVACRVCGLCSTKLLRSLWNHPHRQYEGARGSNWKEWLWSDALCQFDIEKNELNALKVLEGGENDIGAGGWEDGLELEVRGRMRKYKSEIETRPIGVLY
jgi:hypothetical protein